MTTNTLTTKESALLQKHERTIKQTQGAFIACGKALAEIRDQKLYRARFRSFEEYCQTVWQWGIERARQLIDGASVLNDLPTALQPLLENEAQARALSKVPKESRAAVLKDAAATGRVTAPSIARAAYNGANSCAEPCANSCAQNTNSCWGVFADSEALNPQTGPLEKNGKIAAQSSPGTPDQPLRDATGFAIPAALVPMWNRRGEVEEVLKAISQARSAVRRAMQQEDSLFRFANMSGTCSELSHSYSQIQLAMPYAVCCTCQGISSEKCVVCKGGGFISKLHYDVSVPVEIKAIRSRSCVL